MERGVGSDSSTAAAARRIAVLSRAAANAAGGGLSRPPWPDDSDPLPIEPAC
jgi:hypothetical protein